MTNGRTIILDIGHARYTGAKGNGCHEHEEMESFAPILASSLRKRGFGVEIVDYPHADNTADLVATVKRCNTLRPDFILSLHMDSSDSATARGGHVCYLSKKGQRMASCIASHLCDIFPGRAQRVQHRPGLYVLSHTVSPAVLIETCFISSPDDMEIYMSNRDRVAEAIASGVSNYFSD